MTYQTCEDCGSKMSGGFCTWCNEEVFIAEQYQEIGEEVPEAISKKEAEQRANPAKPYQPKYK